MGAASAMARLKRDVLSSSQTGMDEGRAPGPGIGEGRPEGGTLPVGGTLAGRTLTGGRMLSGGGTLAGAGRTLPRAD